MGLLLRAELGGFETSALMCINTAPLVALTQSAWRRESPAVDDPEAALRPVRLKVSGAGRRLIEEKLPLNLVFRVPTEAR